MHVRRFVAFCVTLLLPLTAWAAEENDAVIDALVEAAADREATVRVAALEALGRVSGGEHRVLATFERALRDDNRRVRYAALESLINTDASVEDKAKVLLSSLVDDNWAEEKPEWLTAQFTRLGSDAIPLLVDALESGKHDRAVVLALAEFGPAAKPATEQLLKLLKAENADLRAASVVALGAIHASPKPNDVMQRYARELIRRYDTNKDGSLSSEEGSQLRRLEFKDADANEDGSLTIDELGKYDWPRQ